MPKLFILILQQIILSGQSNSILNYLSGGWKSPLADRIILGRIGVPSVDEYITKVEKPGWKIVAP